MKICHLAITHNVLADSRILDRMAKRAALSGHNVVIITSGAESQIIDNVRLETVSINKLSRLFYPILWIKCLIQAIQEKSDIYHIHEVPLMLTGLILKALGKKIVVDFHEDFEAELFEKHYLNKFLMWFFYALYQPFKWIFVPIFDHIVIAEDSYRLNFPHVSHKLTSIKNYPKVEEFKFNEYLMSDILKVLYVGALTEDRGCKNIVEATKKILSTSKMEINLTLIGPIPAKKLKQFILSAVSSSEGKINWEGPLPYERIKADMTNYTIGFAALHDNPNYRNSLPTKILEYNSAGLMCIASDLPITRSYVKENFNGFVVRPNSTKDIVEVLIKFYKGEKYSNRKTIRDWVFQEFSWENEYDKLSDLYHKLHSHT